MADLTERLLNPETVEAALEDHDFCCCFEGMDAIRELHKRAEQYRQNWLSLQNATGEECHLRALEVIREIPELHRRLEAAKAEGEKAEFDRGWRAAKAEITAALGSDWQGIYLGAKEPWALKVAELLKAAKAEGAAEELERIYAGKGSSTEFDPEYLLRRAAALRKQADAARAGVKQ